MIQTPIPKAIISTAYEMPLSTVMNARIGAPSADSSLMV
jgi:hypothetical protein